VSYDKCHMSQSHDEYGKIVYGPCSSCISSIQEDSIEFSLSTQTWSMIKSSQAKLLQTGTMCPTHVMMIMSQT